MTEAVRKHMYRGMVLTNPERKWHVHTIHGFMVGTTETRAGAEKMVDEYVELRT